MTPIEQAAAVYQREECARSFREDLEAHLLHGLVFSTPRGFIMARYVRRDWAHSAIVDPWQNGENEATCAPEKDCLHVYLAAGELSEFFTFPHRRVLWVSFERSNRLHFHPYNRIQRLCSKIPIPLAPTMRPA